MNDVNPMKTHFFRFGFIAILAMALLTGCDKPEQEVLIEKDDDRYQASLNEEAAYLQDVSFLEINQGNVAAIWLAMQANKQTANYAPSVEDVKEYEALIMPITKKLLEDRRMVANRTVQTRDALAESAIEESIPNLLTGLATVAEAGTEGTFSEYCQWYLMLRQNQQSHEEALAKMKDFKDA